MALWDTGVKLYALPYYATTKTLQSQGRRARRVHSRRREGLAVGRQEP